MPKTNADYQRDHRQRRAHRLAELEAENASLRAELDSVRAELDAALTECERLAAMACRHPAGAVDGGTCQACGTEVW
jgi:chromosome segregation ATPase